MREAIQNLSAGSDRSAARIRSAIRFRKIIRFHTILYTKQSSARAAHPLRGGGS
jgi:hypothetical protein